MAKDGSKLDTRELLTLWGTTSVQGGGDGTVESSKDALLTEKFDAVSSDLEKSISGLEDDLVLALN